MNLFLYAAIKSFVFSSRAVSSAKIAFALYCFEIISTLFCNSPGIDKLNAFMK
jgi:hypothetical protein